MHISLARRCTKKSLFAATNEIYKSKRKLERIICITIPVKIPLPPPFIGII